MPKTCRRCTVLFCFLAWTVAPPLVGGQEPAPGDSKSSPDIGAPSSDAPADSGNGTAAEDQLQAMEFLAGTWVGQVGGGQFTAHYTSPASGKLLSYSVLKRDGAVVFYEFELFEVVGETVVFTPHPGGKPAVQLRLSELDLGNQRVVFENPGKDFPTRIEYHQTSEDRLVITLSDPHHDDPRVQTFDLSRP